MVNRLCFLSLLFVAVGLFGCGSKDHADITISGSNGEKFSLKSDGDQGNLSISGTNGEKVNIDGKNGEMTMSSTDSNGEKTTAKMGGNTPITEADLGVPFYPGSVEKPSEQMRVETDTEKDFMSTRTTADEPAKVAEFYKEKVKGSTVSSFNNDGMTMAICSGVLESGAKFSLTAERKKDDHETKIKIGISAKK